jgi:transposase
MMLAIRQAQERLDRLGQAIGAAVPDWSLAEAVTALMAMRGLDLIAAATFMAEIGDLTRFQTPQQLMAYLGLVPSEDSTGDTVKRGPITKPATACPAHAGGVLVELSASAGSDKPSNRRSMRHRRRFARCLEGAVPAVRPIA